MGNPLKDFWLPIKANPYNEENCEQCHDRLVQEAMVGVCPERYGLSWKCQKTTGRPVFILAVEAIPPCKGQISPYYAYLEDNFY